MPSFDINAILSAALATAVAEAVAPLVERIATLETRLAALENNPAIGVDTTLERRVAALEAHTTVLDQHGGLLEYLDNQEWFWEKLTRKAKEVAPTTDITQHIIESLSDIEHPLFKRMSSFMDAVAERAMEEHTEEYNHDNYDDAVSKVEDIDFDELAKTDDLSEAVRDAVQDLSFEIRVS